MALNFSNMALNFSIIRFSKKGQTNPPWLSAVRSSVTNLLHQFWQGGRQCCWLPLLSGSSLAEEYQEGRHILSPYTAFLPSTFGANQHSK